MGKVVDRYIALNGCLVKCAMKALESADIPVDDEVLITEKFDIKKNKNLKSKEKINEIIDELKQLIDK